MKKLTALLILVLIFLSENVSSQELDITPYLKEIESGNATKVLKILPQLKKENPADPSVIFLDAVLTTNGEEALKKYFKVYSQYPKSNYADASLYRIFSFYFSMGLYNKAQSYLEKLKEEYPRSPYIQYADRNIPQQDLDSLVIAKKGKIKSETISKRKSKKSPVVIKKKPSLSKTYFTIQAGAFLNNDNAKKLRKKFEAKSWSSEIYTKDIGGSVFNVVTVGKFSSKKDAEKLLAEIKKEFGISGRIVLKQ